MNLIGPPPVKLVIKKWILVEEISKITKNGRYQNININNWGLHNEVTSYYLVSKLIKDLQSWWKVAM